MSLNVQEVSLDITRRPTPQQVTLGQGDANATTLIVKVYDTGDEYDLDAYGVRLATRLPNSDNYYGVNGTAQGNVATFEIDETYAAATHGFDGYGYVEVLDGDTVICSTSRFQLVVLRSAEDGADPSTAYSNGIREATERAIAAAEAAEGVVLQDVPTMSALIKGGALLGSGLEVEDQALSVSPVTTAQVDGIMADTAVTGDESLSATGLAYFWGKLKAWALGAFAALAHTHAASDVTSGTLPVARGGTGLASSPSMLADLGSTTAADVMAASPRPGVTGTLPVDHGGTGATTAAGARAELSVPEYSGGVLNIGGTSAYLLFKTTAIASFAPPTGVGACMVLDTSDNGLYWYTA